MASANKRVIIVNEEDEVKTSVTERGDKGTLAVEVLDGDGEQVINFGGTETAHDTVGSGTTTITYKGTPVQLSTTSVTCKRVYVNAHESNSGTVVVGDINIVAYLTGRRGYPLYPTQGEWFNVSNLNLLYVNSTASGDIVHFLYEN